jgi:carbonic anhydrase
MGRIVGYGVSIMSTRRAALHSFGVTTVAVLASGLPAGASSEDPEGVTAALTTVDRPGAAEALADLLAGNRRFVAGRPRYGHDVQSARAHAGEQHPYAFVLGCLDSRLAPEAVFDQDFGSIVVGRTGGGVLDRAVLGSVEFAVAELGVPLVLVLGHDRCGAVAATVDALRTGRRPAGPLAYLVDEIAPAVAEAGGPHHPHIHDLAMRRHVARTVDRLRHLPDHAAVVGAVYDMASGRVSRT